VRGPGVGRARWLSRAAVILGRLADYATTRILLSSDPYARECNPVARLVGLEPFIALGAAVLLLLQLYFEWLARRARWRPVRWLALGYMPATSWLPALHNALIIAGLEQGLLLDRLYPPVG